MRSTPLPQLFFLFLTPLPLDRFHSRSQLEFAASTAFIALQTNKSFSETEQLRVLDLPRMCPRKAFDDAHLWFLVLQNNAPQLQSKHLTWEEIRLFLQPVSSQPHQQCVQEAHSTRATSPHFRIGSGSRVSK